jgi:hypothetical protein
VRNDGNIAVSARSQKDLADAYHQLGFRARQIGDDEAER